jgi:ferrochelatase
MKIAVILFNLGGPDSLEAVQPFLRNLFGDRAIIDLPGWLRLPLARVLARSRAVKARKIYAQIGGSSPILGQSETQARALEQALAGDGNTWRAFVCMRYWHPLTEEIVQQVRGFAPDRVLLLPLYPQFSTTTTASSIASWQREIGRFAVSTRTVCCYPEEPGFIEASAQLIRAELATLEKGAFSLLFSAHGLPEKVIEAGDPYQYQVERTAAAIARLLSLNAADDWRVCYQSRVGPLKWIGPSTEHEILVAGRAGKAVVIYPLSFVSEHSETLVELDRQFRELANRSGVRDYRRVATVGTHKAFIDGLARLARGALQSSEPVCNDGTVVKCPAVHLRCPRLTGSL